MSLISQAIDLLDQRWDEIQQLQLELDKSYEEEAQQYEEYTLEISHIKDAIASLEGFE